MQKINTMSEDRIQADFYQTAFNTYPQIRGLLFAVPNGGSRDVREGAKLKATGTTAGIPDMLLLWGGTIYGFEFKTETGVLSEAQRKIHQRWKDAGYSVAVYRSSEAALTALRLIIFGEPVKAV